MGNDYLPNRILEMQNFFGNGLSLDTVLNLSKKLILFVEDGNHGNNRPRQDEFVENGIPFIRPPNLINGRVDFDNCSYINDTAFDRVRKGIGKPGDIILTHRATVGRLAITDFSAPVVFVTNPGTTIWRSTNQKILHQKYLYYYMQSPTFMEQLWSRVGNNCTFDYVSLTQQRSLLVAYPSIEEQRAIAHVLSTLDDKIDLNRKMNENLEGIARTLFKSWFVDFDPVRMKMDGRKPAGMDDETAELFPDELVFNEELGKEVPRGWGVQKIMEIGKIVTGGTPSTKNSDYYGCDYPFIRIPDMRNNVFTFHTEIKLSKEGADSKKKKILPPFSVCVSCIATPGLVTLTVEESLTNQQINSIICNDNYSPFFTYHLMKNIYSEIICKSSGGTATLNLNKGQFSSIRIIVPHQIIMNIFHKSIKPFFLKILSNQKEVLSLTNTRNTLLPKLISGQIQIDDSQRFLEEKHLVEGPI